MTVRQKFIRTGAARGAMVSVDSGLQAGERLVSSGVFKLRNGMSVAESNALSPPSEEAPRVSNH